jgi:PleD family two-component response regulator
MSESGIPKTKNTVSVLLVEDDESYAKLVEVKLAKSELAFFQLQHAVSLKDFQSKLQRSKPDVILSDLGLPESTGLDTFRKVIRWAKNIPVVVLTGHEDARAGLSAVGLGAQEYLSKTAAAADFIAQCLLHAIERNRLRVELKQTNEKLSRPAVTDPLTGLLNRRGLEY